MKYKSSSSNESSSSNSNMAPKGGESESRDSSTHGISDAIQALPLEVKVYGNNFDRALKIFRALVQKERILSSYKEKQVYEKPSDKRRRKRVEAQRKRVELEHAKNKPYRRKHPKNRKVEVAKSE